MLSFFFRLDEDNDSILLVSLNDDTHPRNVTNQWGNTVPHSTVQQYEYQSNIQHTLTEYDWMYTHRQEQQVSEEA